MAGQPLFEHRIISVRRRGHESHAEFPEIVPARKQIVADQRDMLYAFAIIGAQIFLNLPATGLTFFIERDADACRRVRSSLSR
jgi:hypothetical protein